MGLRSLHWPTIYGMALVALDHAWESQNLRISSASLSQVTL